MMLQWQACKQRAPEALLLFRLGDFYEAFHEDASVLSKELDVTLTQRQGVPMAGVPFHAAEGYIEKLVTKGHRVAIAEQLDEPAAGKGLVRRDIVRIVTPGTLISSSRLVDKRSHFLACVTELNGIFGLALLDVTTGEFRAMECESLRHLCDELCRQGPKELLLPRNWPHQEWLEEMKRHLNLALHSKEKSHFDHAAACAVLLTHFRVQSLDGFGLKGKVAAINAAGALLHYVHADLSVSVQHIKALHCEHLSCYMLLDKATQKHLELFDPLHDEARTLFAFLDHTATPMGGRLLKEWLLHPLLDVAEIVERQDAIEEILSTPGSEEALKQALSPVRDLERLMMRIQTQCATPRDIEALRFSLEQVPPILQLLTSFRSEKVQALAGQLFDVSALVEKIRSALVDAPSLRVTEGELFKKGYDAQLDALYALKQDSHSFLAAYQNTLKEQTQIKTLKVGYTKAFGYYIEISRGQESKIPDFFERRQTLVNAQRCTTPELKAYEHKMLHAEERIAALQHELFNALCQEAARYAEPVRAIARALAHIDVLRSLAYTAQRYGYTRPIVDESDHFTVVEGRHPVLEPALAGHFIPNDVHLDAECRLMLITGPNMAGKSTYIRQVALIAILAQMGAYVPAKRAHIGLIDRVFSRIGASDDLARGQSTFMVEMTETANILHHATPRSLVILDEIGRGTSTYDGISIAWSVAEYLLTQESKRAKTLFATHYWELTALEKKIPGAVNFNVAVHESEKGIVFLHKIVKGGTDKSYGIHVARLAGLPHAVIKRAEEMLALLEKNSPRGSKSEKQLSFL